MSRPQTKGILISAFFVSLAVTCASFDIDLGRILWISIVLFLVVAIIYFTVWDVVKGGKEKQD